MRIRENYFNITTTSFTIPPEMLEPKKIIHERFINSMNYYEVMSTFDQIFDTIRRGEQIYQYAEISSNAQQTLLHKAISNSNLVNTSVYIKDVTFGDVLQEYTLKKLIDFKYDEFVRLFRLLIVKDEQHYYGYYKGMTVSMVIPEYFKWEGL